MTGDTTDLPMKIKAKEKGCNFFNHMSKKEGVRVRSQESLAGNNKALVEPFFLLQSYLPFLAFPRRTREISRSAATAAVITKILEESTSVISLVDIAPIRLIIAARHATSH